MRINAAEIARQKRMNQLYKLIEPLLDGDTDTVATNIREAGLTGQHASDVIAFGCLLKIALASIDIAENDSAVTTSTATVRAGLATALDELDIEDELIRRWASPTETRTEL